MVESWKMSTLRSGKHDLVDRVRHGLTWKSVKQAGDEHVVIVNLTTNRKIVIWLV